MNYDTATASLFTITARTVAAYDAAQDWIANEAPWSSNAPTAHSGYALRTFVLSLYSLLIIYLIACLSPSSISSSTGFAWLSAVYD